MADFIRVRQWSPRTGIRPALPQVSRTEDARVPQSRRGGFMMVHDDAHGPLPTLNQVRAWAVHTLRRTACAAARPARMAPSLCPANEIGRAPCRARAAPRDAA